METDISPIEIPFENRHQCWFCGEPSSTDFVFPRTTEQKLVCKHASLSLPSCQECESFAKKSEQLSIFLIAQCVKKQLIRCYNKHLAIGLNWTKQELAESNFKGGNFEGFQRSAWFMFEVAKARVNFQAWEVVLEGIPLENNGDARRFLFDGVDYPSLDEAIAHYSETFLFDQKFFTSVLYLLGLDKFSQAVRICRLHVGATPVERQQVLLGMQHSENE